MFGKAFQEPGGEHAVQAVAGARRVDRLHVRRRNALPAVEDRAARTDREDDVKIAMLCADRLRVFAEKP